MVNVIQEEIHQLELLCTHLYQSNDAGQQAEAEKALVNFQNSPDSLVKCQLLLERASSPYAQLIAATTLTKLVCRPAQMIPLQQRIQIRTYILNYLGTRIKLESFVVDALKVLFARITKLGWFDTDEEGNHVFRNVVTDVGTFLQGSVEHCTIGVGLLSALISEVNQVSEADANRSLTKHRKIAASFRDQQLFGIFRLCCTLLKTGLENGKNIINYDESVQYSWMSQLLRLASNCLTFDFIGTLSDESSDDICSLQVPTNWRPAFLDFGTLQLFFDLYQALPLALSPTALFCLVQIASIRRSLFSNAERGKFLAHLVSGIRGILSNPSRLSDTNNYHEFCRLLARLKANYQLGELVVVDGYAEAVQLIAKFTVDSLQQMLQVAPNSVHYLLSLWQRLVSSLPYVKATEPHLLETYAPEITRAYISSCMDSVGVCVRDGGSENPLDDASTVTQQLEQLSAIGRCEYQKTVALVAQLFDQAAQSYQEILQRGAPAPVELAIQEGQLTWLVYIIGAAIGGRVSFNSSEEHDSMDGELVCRVLQLMQLTDSRLGQAGCERLESAYVSFLEQFRKIYAGDQIEKASKVYRRLSQLLGLSDETMVLGVFIRKIITNLRYWSRTELLLSKTLNLLGELSAGVNNLRKLVKLDEVQFMLKNHTGEHFPFLGPNQNVNDLRFRSTFYTAVGRLLMAELGEDEDKFQTFMAPLTAQMESVAQLLAAAETISLVTKEEVKWRIVGLARDLKGLAFSFDTQISYMMLFDWIFPAYTPILQRAVELWFHDPAVTTPVLKLFAELATNRSHRLTFDICSPNGILLFREVSKMICAYGNSILSLDISAEQQYQLKLKGVSTCFRMLKVALCGKYVNFGVFRLYGDAALENVLTCFVKLLVSIPLSDLKDFRKLSLNYYGVLECVAQDHMTFLASMEPNVFLYILSSISEGLSTLTLDALACAGCCTTLDHIVSFLFKQWTAKNKNDPRLFPVGGSSERVLQTVEQHPEILRRMFETVLNIVMFEECRNQWSISRPLLGLILLNEEYFVQLRENIIRNQPPEKQASMAEWFGKLMEGIQRNLTLRNRDRFTQNLSVFRRNVNESMRAPDRNAESANDMVTG